MKTSKVVVIGGAGHIGLPLGLVLANLGHEVTCLDIDQQAVNQINNGKMPFMETGAEELLAHVLSNRPFKASTNYEEISSAEIIVVCIGTPVDEHLSPVPRIFLEFLKNLKPYLTEGQLIILRSTVYPGTTNLAANYLQDLGVHVAFCPERILQGKAIEEMGTIPSIVSGTSKIALDKATEFFMSLGSVVTASVEEAEFAKLFLNTYRYIEFATSNQLYTIANDAGVDYSRILAIMKYEYPRASKFPGPGLTAGPCLMKDTMQLVAFSQNRFTLGSAAFFANEGLALYIVDKLKNSVNLAKSNVGILGMAFKANNDDIRSSLSYRVRKSLQLAGATVFAADKNVKNDISLISEEEVIEKSDLIIICTPHEEYRDLDFKNRRVIDIWNLLGEGNLIS